MLEKLKAYIVEKLNPAQRIISEGIVSSPEPTYSYEQMYEQLEIVNRGVNMIVDDTAEIPCKVLEQISGGIKKGLKKAKIETLLNVSPNPYQDINTFKRNIIIDFLLDGNIFIYFDGAYLFHLPACKVQIITDSVTYIKEYKFNNEISYVPEEIIHIKENSFDSIFRGTSRLRPALRTMNLLISMRKFQDNFFKNGAIPGLVLKTPDILSETIKNKMIASWMQTYRPDAGGKRPLILDAGMSVEPLNKTNFQELEFEGSLDKNEIRVCKALGIPPILLDGGNNANISPNLRLYYLETVLSIVKKMNYAFTRYFGFKITEDTTDIVAMQPELKDQASYFTTLVNGGIISPNEARDDLGRDSKPGHDDLRIPANIAGSAADPSQGGRPNET